MNAVQVEAPIRPGADLDREFTLRDGRRARLRPIRSGDAEPLRGFVDGLSERSRRLRFFGYKPPLDPELARTMTRVDFRDRMAFVAVLEDDARMVADCRLCRTSNRQAEVAIAVADDCQGLGLGRALLEHVLIAAAAAGFEEIVAQVRYDNERMIRLLRDLGFRRVGWELGVLTFVRAPGVGAPATPTGTNDPAVEGDTVRFGVAAGVSSRDHPMDPKAPTPERSGREPATPRRAAGRGRLLETLPSLFPLPPSPPGDPSPGGMEGRFDPAEGRRRGAG
jgi:RimJ/RimL family protein N-acetyltransferase